MQNSYYFSKHYVQKKLSHKYFLILFSCRRRRADLVVSITVVLVVVLVVLVVVLKPLPLLSE